MIRTVGRRIGWNGFRVLWLLTLAVYGCGGGGGGGGDPVTASPVAVAQASLSIANPDDEVSLDGSGSTDADGEIVSYKWIQTQGTGVSLSDAETSLARFQAPVTEAREELVFSLTVADDDGNEGTSSVAVTVNARPSADAGADQFGYEQSAVALYATDADSDGSVEYRRWEQIAGTDVGQLEGQDTASLRFTTPAGTGVLTFRYTVTDDDGAQRSDTVSVYVSRIRFFDSFSDDGNWITVNENPDPGTFPAQWQVEAVSGRYVQQNNVERRSLDESYHLGTFAYLDESVLDSSAAFRFSVEITPLANNNGDDREGNDVGIMFPYASTGSGRYYRLTMNARYGYTRLEKWDGSAFSTLSVNSIGYEEEGVTFTMTVEVNGDTIMAFIDGEPVFAASNQVIYPGTVALYCQDKAGFDNVIIADNSLQPMIAVSSPVAYSVPLVAGGGDAISAEAVTLNAPAGAGVVFNLDDGGDTPASAMGNLYTAQLSVSTGEHEIAAVLKSADGQHLSSDTNMMVGVGGDHYIAAGDSITNGVGDGHPANNLSEDGRIVAIQGFEAPLNDLLTAGTGLPQIVFNEGIGGDRSYHLSEERIDSILDRHPGANRMLLLIGTNDVWTGQPVGQFETYLEQIVTAALSGAIDRVYVALIPPFRNYPDQVLDAASLNTRAQTYNQSIRTFVSGYGSDAVMLGPDFYDLFITQMDQWYTDGVHPNDDGYAEMAEAWYAILNP